MQKLALFFLLPFVSLAQDWTTIKDTSLPELHLTGEFNPPYQQPISSLGWEDGVHISPNGLYLYCTYAPIDILSFSLNGDLPNDWSSDYSRGAPLHGMDMITNPIGASEWLHSDILIATRPTTSVPFSSWNVSNMARPFYSEGAPMPLFENDTLVDLMFFTSNDNYTNNSDIWVINNTTYNPSGVGDSLHPPVNTAFKEDNPNLTRLSPTELVLFFDSDDLPGGMGDIDLWYTTSADNGATWATPFNVSSINSAEQEHQPFLFYDYEAANWYLYFSAKHSDGKLAIFRAAQNTFGDWDDWATPELVISAGTTAGIGEPTLTMTGDLSFVVVYQDPLNTSIYNRFDADAWYLPKKFMMTVPEKKEQFLQYLPLQKVVQFIDNNEEQTVVIYSISGQIILESTTNEIISTHNWEKGIYFAQIKNGMHNFTQKFVVY